MARQSIPLIKQFVALVRIKPFVNSLKITEGWAENIISDLNLIVVKKFSYAFSPVGITLGYVLSQSHLMIHTYPAEGIIHIDLVICSERDKEEFKKSLKSAFYNKKIYSIEIKTIDWKETF